MQGLLLAGRYRLVDAIGSGGMGRVWRAHDEVLHRAVAVKELTAALYVSESDREVLLARTRAEARAAARINHSAVVTVHDVLDHDGRPWIVMELVEGRSLADAVKEEGRVEPQEAARVGLWVLRALRAAHAAGVLHRDVKPGNVLLARDGRVLLTDFGIAQVEGDSTITRTGEIVGSVDYLAPERIRGADPGPASDLWALGATLHTAVEGTSPFRRTSPLTTMQAVVDEEPPEPRAAGPLAPVIAALLCKDPAARPDAEQAERMLAEAAEGRHPGTAEPHAPTRRMTTGPAATGPAATAHPEHGHGPDRGHEYDTPAPGRTPAPHGHSAAGAPGRYPTVAGPQGGYPAAGPYGYPHSPAPAGPSTPYPPVTAPQPAVRGKRRLARALAAVAALVVLAGGGGALALYYADGGRRDGETSASGGTGGTDGSQGSQDGRSTPSPSSSPSATQPTTVPDGWKRVEDPEGGFSLALPEGWERRAEDGQIDYTPDGGDHFVRIAVDGSPDYDDPREHQLDLEKQLARLQDYARVSLESNVFRDRPGALWDFTWTALGKDSAFPGPRRAIEQAYISREGVEYVIYMSSPAGDWETAREQFDTVLRSWRPAPAG
ncbi:serine/threonine protein kinase [Streptomyces minutiscleroticus]|uniref:non-specific serine/threonine protein kinase n=1 Tax=Streptomyces minutiscleroticus TaxID=68238 RepID=A0A918KLX2_9ACTN|nr:serine/threonine-protein kinase [Streptomyces minutiscleroticus]GGX67990.1 serine/threonine protein kinase [Streptomyces minutiscleroticus]